jgi:hypothetical protein
MPAVSFETALWDSLTGDQPLSALISTRIYRSRVEEKPTVPYVRMYQVRNKVSQALRGNIVAEGSVLVFQIFAATDDSAISIRDAMRAALIASGSPVVFEDDISGSDAISGLRRRDMTVRVAHA